MKRLTVLLIMFSLLLAIAFPAYSRNIKYILPISSAMEVKDADEKPTGAVKFFFAAQKSPTVITKLETYIARPRANAMSKSDEKACNWAFLATLAALEKRTLKLGGNAVVNIVSYYNKDEMSSTTEFECHVGNVIAIVAFKGDIVKVADE